MDKKRNIQVMKMDFKISCKHPLVLSKVALAALAMEILNYLFQLVRVHNNIELKKPHSSEKF